MMNKFYHSFLSAQESTLEPIILNFGSSEDWQLLLECIALHVFGLFVQH